jgi:hypothetical protein
MQPPQKFWGTFVRKERWSLSWRGWLIVFTGVFLAFYGFWFRVYPLLAVTHRVNTNILVVEGWIRKYAIRAAVDEFRRGSYQEVFTTGGPVEGIGGYINDYQTSASVGADLLKNAGVPPESMQMVPSHVMDRDRTYSSALALRDWFRDHNLAIHSFNVLTEDCHARRTQLLYQEAFGKKFTVGIIAVSNPDYNPKDWWRYSDGVREVVGESIAYIYARFFFYPSVSSSNKETPQADSASR